VHPAADISLGYRGMTAFRFKCHTDEEGSLKIEANFYAVTEWTPLATSAARKEVIERRRHANVSKAGFVSSMKDENQVNQRDVLVDEGKQADIETLGECLRALATARCLVTCR